MEKDIILYVREVISGNSGAGGSGDSPGKGCIPVAEAVRLREKV